MIAAVYFGWFVHSVCVHGIWDYFKLICCVYVCPGIRGQLWSELSPSTFTWAPRVELRSPGLHSKHSVMLNHLTGPEF